MSNKKSQDVEDRLFHLNEEMTRLRMSYTLGNMTTRIYREVLDRLKDEYLTLKRETENEIIEWTDPVYDDEEDYTND